MKKTLKIKAVESKFKTLNAQQSKAVQGGTDGGKEKEKEYSMFEDLSNKGFEPAGSLMLKPRR